MNIKTFFFSCEVPFLLKFVHDGSRALGCLQLAICSVMCLSGIWIMGMQSGSSRPMKPSSLWRRKTLSSDIVNCLPCHILLCEVFVRAWWASCEDLDSLVCSVEHILITLSC